MDMCMTPHFAETRKGCPQKHFHCSNLLDNTFCLHPTRLTKFSLWCVQINQRADLFSS